MVRFMSLFWAYPCNFSGIFFIMCHKHHLCRVWGNTIVMAFFIAWHWSDTIPVELCDTYNVANTQITKQMCLCVLTIAAHTLKEWIARDGWPQQKVQKACHTCSLGMLYRKIQHLQSTAARLLASVQKTFLIRLSSCMSISKKKSLFNFLMHKKCFNNAWPSPSFPSAHLCWEM